MKYMLFICTDPEAEAYTPEGDNIREWVAEMDSSGRRETGDRLRPPEDAATVRVRRGERLVTDGPFAETKEWIAGYDIVECTDLDQAIQCAAKHPMARFGRIEIRPFWPLELKVSPVKPAGKAPVRQNLFFQFVCTDPEAEPYDDAHDSMTQWEQEMQDKGILVTGDRLRPVEDATLVRVRKGQVLVSDGPFAETKEWIAGYDVLACRDKAEALDVAAKHPMARFGRIEVRPFWPLF